MGTIAVFKNRPIEVRENGSWEYLKSEGTALDKLRKAPQSSDVINFFSGLFNKLGLEVIDTKEKITCTLGDGKIDFAADADERSVDFYLPIYRYQVDRLIDNAATGFKEPLSRFRIVREFLNCLPRHSGKLLNRGIVTNTAFRKLIHSKDLLHVYLVSPDTAQEPDATYTLFFVDGRWNTAVGLSGKPDRIFKLSPEDAFELLRQGFAADKARLTDLPKFATWYRGWRKRVEVKAA